MPHLAGKCHCGKPIHFPKDANIGFVWKCHTPGCGEWELNKPKQWSTLTCNTFEAPTERKLSEQTILLKQFRFRLYGCWTNPSVGVCWRNYKLIELLFASTPIIMQDEQFNYLRLLRPLSLTNDKIYDERDFIEFRPSYEYFKFYQETNPNCRSLIYIKLRMLATCQCLRY